MLLVHGLWHGPWCWDEVVLHLSALRVPSLAVDLPLTTLDEDVAVVRAALDQLNGPVVLVGHSYGGAVITGAGVHPKVRGLVYVAGYQLDEGESVSRVLPDDGLPTSRLPEALRVDAELGTVDLDPRLGPALLYSDADPERARAAARRLRPVSRALFGGVLAEIAWRMVSSTYVVCTADEVVHPALQIAMARRATRSVEWSCGHNPALTRPDALADLLASEAAGPTFQRPR